MKYILNYNVDRAIEYKLDVQDLCILYELQNFTSQHSKAIKDKSIINNGDVYYWIDLNKIIINNIKIYKVGKSQISNKLRVLEEKGFIKRFHRFFENKKRTYINCTELCWLLKGEEIDNEINVIKPIKLQVSIRKIDVNVTKEIIKYLNDIVKTKYRHTNKTTQKLITTRLNEGYTVDDFKSVIDNKCADWLNDPKMMNYLRPETLFSNKFESYLNTKIKITTDNLSIDISDF